MPDRIIKESVRRSKTLDSLNWFELVCFLYLTVTVDDYGRFYRDPQILKSELFPRKKGEKIVEEVDAAMNVLEENGLIKTYSWDGETYLQITTWEKHQRTRAKKSKFPDSRGRFTTGANKMKTPDSDPPSNDSELLTSDSKCQQDADIGQQMCPNTKAKAKANTKAEAEEDGLLEIQRDHDELFACAEDVGLPVTNQNMNDIVDLYAEFGKEIVKYAIAEAGRYNKISIAYIKKVCKDFGKDKPVEDEGLPDFSTLVY